MLDTVMISGVGEAAVSGVSFVDNINILLIQPGKLLLLSLLDDDHCHCIDVDLKSQYRKNCFDKAFGTTL